VYDISPPFSRQCVLGLDHCPVIDVADRELAYPRYLLYADEEMSKSVPHLLGELVLLAENSKQYWQELMYPKM
jgi:hypothetical protein